MAVMQVFFKSISSKQNRIIVLSSLSFISLLLVLVGPAIFNGEAIGDGVDLYGTIWFYQWIHDCIINLQNPSFTDLFFYPYGKDIFSHTGNNFVDAVLFFPFKIVFGKTYAYTIFIAFILGINLLSIRVLLNHLLKSQYVIWGASLLWLTCPFVLFELIAGRPTQACLFWTPLAIWTALKLNDETTSLKYALYLGVLVALQGMTYWFYGYFLGAVIITLMLTAPTGSRLNFTQRLWRYGLAGVVCLVLISPFIYHMTQAFSQALIPGLVASSSQATILPNLQNNVLSGLHGFIRVETDGQPILSVLPWALALILCFANTKTRWVWGIPLVVTIIGGAGPEFDIYDWTFTNWPYVVLYKYLPFYGRLWFPYRWLSMTVIILVISLAITLDQWVEQRPKLAIWTIFPFVLALPQLVSNQMLPLLSRTIKSPEVYMEMAKYSGAIIELPIGIAKEGILYQADHKLPTFGGMGENAIIFQPKKHSRRLQNGFIQFLRKTMQNPSEVVDFTDLQKQRITDQGFRYLVLDRSLTEFYAAANKDLPTRNEWPTEVQTQITTKLGPPWAFDGEYVVWALLPTPAADSKFHLPPAEWYTIDWDTKVYPMGGERTMGIGEN